MTSKAIEAKIAQIVSEQDYPGITKHFAEELFSASQDHTQSISFLKNPLPQQPLVSKGIIQGIVMGGTNFETAVISIHNNTSQTLKREKAVLPIMQTAEQFTAFLTRFLDKRADAIAVSFAFPLEPVAGKENTLDGYLIKGTKEHAFDGLLGRTTTVGQYISALFKKLYLKDIITAVANDTVCLALSGDGTETGGLIAGTGMNISLRHDVGDKKFVVNLESGNFKNFTPTDILEIIDRHSPTRGTHRFEKMISGQYLPMHFNELMKQIGADVPTIQSGAILSELAEKDPTVAGETARAILTRSAYLVACELAGIYAFKNKPEGLTFIGVGSLLTKGWLFQKHLQQKLNDLEVPPKTVQIKQVPDCDMQGALGLLVQ